ncbi:MAG TPA: SLC13 family permease, partial [Bacillota bacterium]
VNLLAVSRFGTRPAARVASIRFQPGDILLLQGRADALREVTRRFSLLPLPERGVRLGTAAPAALALTVFAGALAAVVLGLIPFEIAFLGAAVLMVALGVLSPRRAYAAVDWPVIVLIGSMLPLGTALEVSGGAAYLGRLLTAATVDRPGWLALTMLLAATVVLTNLIGAKPAAVLGGSVAVEAAAAMGVSPDPLLMAVAVAASSAFLTPVGHQVNVIVMGPGGYRFADYFRLGLPLTLLTAAAAIPLILHFWPLTP